MASQRIKIIVNKAKMKIQRDQREIARLLEDGKEEKARIRVESVIREDFTMEAMEIVEMLCDLLHERLKYISSSDTCPEDIKVAVCTVIWVSDRIDVPELSTAKSQFGWKYGGKFVKECMDKDALVNERVKTKLKVEPPPGYMVNEYLKNIAKNYEMEWKPSHEFDPSDVPMAPPSGFSVPMAPGSGLTDVYQKSQAEIRQEIEDLSIKKQELEAKISPAPFFGTIPNSAPISVPPAGSDPSSLSALSSGGVSALSPSIESLQPISSDMGVAPMLENSRSIGDPDKMLEEPADPTVPPSDGHDNSLSVPSFDDLEARFAALRNDP